MSSLLDSNLISTRDASKLSGYHSDYLGRLCREGKILGRRVGRAWILDRASLETFVKEQEALKRDNAVELARSREKEYQEAKQKRAVSPEIAVLAVELLPEVPEAPRASEPVAVATVEEPARVEEVISKPRVSVPSPYVAELHPIRDRVVAAMVALGMVASGVGIGSSNLVNEIARISVNGVANASEIGYRELAIIGDSLLVFEDKLGRSILSVADMDMLPEDDASLRFASELGSLTRDPRGIADGIYNAQVALGSTIIGTSDAVLNAHALITDGWVAGSQAVPPRVIAAFYGIGTEGASLAVQAPRALLGAYNGAVLAWVTATPHLAESIVRNEVAFGTAVVSAPTSETLTEAREGLARAFEVRVRAPEARTQLAAVPHEDVLGPARALALFTYESLNRFFATTGNVIAALFSPLAPNVAYAPEIDSGTVGTSFGSVQTVIEVSRIVNQITNNNITSPVTYVYGGVTREYVREAIENLRDDIADDDNSSGGGLADLSNSSIEELSDVGTMVKTWGELLFWNGTEWANLATSSLGISGSGIPGGAPGNVQYNIGGNFGGDASFTFDAAAGRLTFTYGSSTAFSSGYGAFTTLNATTAVIDSITSTLATLGNFTANNGTTTNATSTNLAVINSFALGSDRFTDLTGPGLTSSTGALAVDDVTPAMLQAADFGDFTCNGTSCSLDADTVSDSEMDYGTVTLADFTNDAGFITGIGALSIEDLSDVAAMTETFGDLFSWNGSAWTNVATSSLNIALTNTTGILPINRGGTGTSSAPTYGQLLVGDGVGGYMLVSTSSLGIAGSGGTPGGLTGQVQFNNAGTFGGDTGFTYDAAADRLTATYASSTGFSSIYASSTNVFAGNLTVGSLTGILKATSGVVSAAIAGTDYENPLSFTYPLTRAANTISLAFGTSTTNSWVHQIFSSLVATNASTTNATTSQLAITSLPSQLLRTDGNGRIVSTTIGTGLSFDGTTLSATGGGGIGNVATSTTEVAGQLPYWTTSGGSPARLGSVATSTFAVSGPFNVSGSLGSLVGGSNATISYYGLATTSNITQGQVLYGTSASGVASVATSTATLSGAFSYSGTLGSFVGGAAGTLSLATNGVALSNLAQIAANTVLANPTGAAGNVQAIATSTFFGTGTGGYVLSWNNGAPTWVATTSINNGVSSIQQTGGGSPQTGAITFATTSATSNGLTSSLAITNTGGAFTFSPSLSGTLTVAGGGTGATSFTSGQLVYGAGTGALQSVATSSISNGTGITVTGSASVVGPGGLTITNTGVTSIAGTTNQITASAGTGAVTLSLPSLVAFPNAYTALYGTTTYASSTALSTGYASSTNLFAGNLTLGSLNGPLQANNGVVSATTSIGAIYGGTGQSSYAVGDILYADSATSLARLPVSTNGLVLKLVGGLPSWQPDLTTGGGGGAGAWSTTTDSLAVYPTDTSNVIIIGASATSTLTSIFEVAGRSYFSNTLSIGTTSGSSLFRLAVQGNGLFSGNVNTANLTATGTVSALNASFTNASTTSFGLNAETFTDLTGTGLQNVGGVLTINATGDWTGTFDGQEGTYYLNRANHTGTQLAATISDFDTAVNTYIAGSTTIPKTYTANTFTAANVFSGGVTIGTLNGPLQANNGVVSATTSIGVLYGGTGLTTAPTYGQILVGNPSNGYTLTATSSLGLPTFADLAGYSTFAYPFPGNATSTTITFNGGLVSVGSTTINGNATTTGMQGVGSLFINSERFTDLTGTGLQNVGGALTLNATGDWTGTFDGQEGSYYLNRANHTGTQLAATISDFDTAVNAYIHGSTTIPKTYTANTFTAANVFSGGVTIGTLNGPLQANNGVVSATTSVGVLYGGTGLTAAPTYGQILVGNALGGYTLTATSSLGLVTNAIQAIGPAGQTQTGPTVTFATSSTAFNGLTASTTITATGNTITFANTLAGLLGVAGGGTGSTTLGGILTGNGTSGVTSATVSAPLTFSGNTLAISQANGSTNGYLSSTDWNTFNNKISSTSLSGASVISYTSGTGVITTTGGTFGAGNYVFPSALTVQGQSSFQNASTTNFSNTGIAYFGGTATTTISGNGSITLPSAATLTIGTLTGPLQAVNGVVSASSTLSVAYGGTGWNSIQANAVLYGNGAGALATTSAGTNGQVLALVGGVPTWVATTSINNGVTSIQQTGGGSAQTGAITFATTSATSNGLSSSLAITNTGGAFTFSPSLSGTLTVPGGGTGATSFTSGQLVYGAGTGALQTVATTTVSASGPLSLTSNPVVIGASPITLSITQANGSTNGYLSSTDWNLFNNKVSSSSLFTYVAGNRDWSLTTNTFGQSSLAPTTTQNIAVSGTGTSTFAGGLEAWRQISAPYFQGTSSATSTFAGGIRALRFNATGTSTLAGVDITAGCYAVNGTCLSLSNLGGTLGIANGGTGTTTAPVGQLIYGGATAYQSVATSSLAISGAFNYSGTLGSLVGGANGTLSLATNGVALTNLAQIGANTVLANPTGAAGNVQAIATSTFFGTGIGGYVLTWNNGAPQWVASTTYANGTGISTAFAGGQLTITNTGVTSLSGTTNQITASAATGPVTLSLPSLVAFPNAYTATYGTTTYASSTAFSATYASSTQVVAGNLTIGTLSGLLRATNGVVSVATAGTDYIAGGAGAATSTVSCSGTASCTPFVAFASGPITISGTGIASYDAFTHPAANQSATTSLMLFNGNASSTQLSAYVGYFGSTATTTISANGSITTPTGSSLTFTPYTGFLASNGASGVSARTITGTPNQLTVTNGDGTAGNPTLSLPNLVVFPGNASTTQLSALGPFYVGTTSSTTIWGNATSTFTGGVNLTAGCFALNGTCVAGAGSTGTVNNGTTGQMPYYAANGNTLTATSTLFITSASDVGIGTNGPVHYGDGYTTLAIDGNATGVLDVMANGGIQGTLYNQGSAFRVGNRTAGELELITDNTPQVTISAAGNVVVNNGSFTVSALGTGLVRATSGTLGLATAGTDYIAGGAGAATSTVSCAGTAACTPFVAFASSPITITGSGLSSYDAWTHPVAGQSATTSLMLFNGNASTTQLSATRAYFGGSATSTFTSTGFLGIGSSTPWAQLSVNPTSANGTAPSFVIGSSTGTKFIVRNDGSVGIGTAAPTDALYIQDPDGRGLTIDQGSISLLNPSGNAGRLSFNGGSDTTRFWFSPSHEQNYISFDDVGDGYSHVLAIEGGAGTDTGLLYFDSTENIGVATSSPYARLSVWGKSTGKIFEAVTAASSSALSVSATGFGTTTVSGLTISGSATSTSNVGFNITTGCYAVNGTCISGGGSGLSSYDAWTHASIYQSATTSMMGFGTTTPRWALQVASSTAPQLTLSDTTGGHWSFRSINGNLYIATSSATTFATTSTTALTINSVGNIGIGSSSPWGQLSINANGGVTGSNPLFTIGSSTSNLLVVDYAGRMGLGTTSPYAKLSVVGETVSTFFTATSTSATSTFAGGLNVGSGALTHDFTSGVTSIGNLAIGAMTFDTNSGVISWVDMPVTSTASAGTAQSYSAQLDGTPVLTVYGVSDGAGGIASTSVGISSSTPWGMFSVEQTNGTTSPVFVVSDQGTSTPHLYIGANGRVGVGTTSPWARTSLNAPAGEAAFAIGSSTRNLFYVTALGTTTVGRGLDIIGAVATSSSNVGWNITTGCYAINNTCLSSGLSSYDAWTHASIYQSATTSMMGFGTTTPRWALQVASSTAPQLALSDGSLTSNHWTFRNAGGGLFIGTSSPLTFATTTISALTINASGNLGIGTTSPSSRLTVAGSGFFEGSNNYINFATTTGANGYGFRDNGGVMEFKNMGGTWQGVTTATTGPSFSVHKNASNQTVTAGVDTLLTWSTEEFDTNNNFNLGTGRFQPTVPGKYVVYAQVRTTDGTSASVSIYKNGSVYKLGVVGSALITNVSAVVDMNGSTDYIEAYVTNTGGTTVSGATAQTYFYGIMVAPVNNNVVANLNLQYDGTQTTQIDQTKFFGIGTSSPWAQFAINPLASNGSAPSFVIGSSTATHLIVTNAGNLGLGTSTPFWKLNIADATKSQLTLSDGSATQNPWSFRSINGNLYIATSSPSTLATSTVAALTINSNGTVLVGNGLGKLTIGTLDPVYTVNGTAYATYMAGMIGVKEETTGNAVIDTPMTADDGSTGYVTVLDFDELEAGSDLWLFSQTTHIRKNIDKLVVLLSAENGGKVWYEIDKAERKVYLLADRPTRVSYRMTAPRFDSETWTNYNHDGVTGFRPPSDDLTVYFTDNHELSFGNANLLSGTTTLATLLEEYDEEGEEELKPWTAALVEASDGLKTAMDDLSNQVIEVMHGAQYFADGIFKRIFAQEVYTDKICVTDAEGETCLTRAQLQQLLSGAAASGGGGNGGGSGGDTGGGDTGGDTGGGDTGGDTGEGDTGGDEGGGDAGDGSEGDTGGGGTGGDEGGGDTGGDTGGGDTGGDGGGDSGGDTGGGDAGGGDSGGDAGGGAP